MKIKAVPLVTILLLTAALANLADWAGADLPLSRLDLSGHVLTEIGTPLVGATVLIHSARPRQGTSPFCPTCYPDCRKNAQSGPDGAFTISSLDPSLVYQLLVVATERQATLVPQADPTKGSMDIKIRPLARNTLTPKHQLAGQIVGPDRKSVSKAVVTFEVFFGDEVNCGGNCEGVDPMAVTDDQGEFLLTSRKRFDWMTVTVEAPSLARRRFFKLPSGSHHQLQLMEGATITGRVIKDGRTMPNVGVGLVSIDRGENFTGDFNTVTGSNGQFAFFNVPPFHQYAVYGLMDSLRSVGASSIVKVRVGADGGSKIAPDVILNPGVHVAGRVRTADQTPVPPGTRILLSREGAWDTATRELNPDGSFAFENVPDGVVDLSLAVPGYRFSEKNASLDRLNGGTIIGQVLTDILGIEILLEPGNFVPGDPHAAARLPDPPLPNQQPLRGAEASSL